MDYIFDIDGTLLDITHRLKFIDGGRNPQPLTNEQQTASKKDWKSFRDPKQKRWDEPILPVIYLMNSLHYEGHNIIIASGRTKDEESDTRKSLAVWAPYITEVDSPVDYLIPMYMRSLNDYRKDAVVKSAMLDRMRLDGYDPKMVFDDRPTVINMWRDRGLVVADMRDPAKGDF